MCQGGDITEGSGYGGTSIYGENFEVDFTKKKYLETKRKVSKFTNVYTHACYSKYSILGL